MVRLAVNLLGAPPLEGQGFASYRAGIESETIVGVGLAVQVPLGEYFEDKLINLGSNRFTIQPQLGVVRSRGRWSFELTGSTWIFTNNDDFFGGKTLEQDPFFSIQGHVVYSFRPGLWIAGGLAYGIGQESTVDGDDKDDRKEDIVFGFSVGYPITRSFGVEVGYIGARAQAETGIDFDSFRVCASYLFWADVSKADRQTQAVVTPEAARVDRQRIDRRWDAAQSPGPLNATAADPPPPRFEGSPGA